eukprot:4086752-Amphidinium_carterae.1
MLSCPLAQEEEQSWLGSWVSYFISGGARAHTNCPLKQVAMLTNWQNCVPLCVLAELQLGVVFEISLAATLARAFGSVFDSLELNFALLRCRRTLRRSTSLLSSVAMSIRAKAPRPAACSLSWVASQSVSWRSSRQRLSAWVRAPLPSLSTWTGSPVTMA